MIRYQVVKLEPRREGESMRWQFLAHGAAYSKDEAFLAAAILKARGCKVKLLPLPKGV